MNISYLQISIIAVCLLLAVLPFFMYGCMQLYQYNEDDFFIQVLIAVKQLFSKYNFTRNWREAGLIDSFSLFPYVCVSMLFKRLI